jgi:hypothetical protein
MANPQGRRHFSSCIERIPVCTVQAKQLGAEIVDSIEFLLSGMEFVSQEIIDGRLYLEPVCKSFLPLSPCTSTNAWLPLWECSCHLSGSLTH